MSWNPSLHPRYPDGRFRPTVTSATFYAGRGGDFYGVKVGATVRLPTLKGKKGKGTGTSGSRVLVKGIAGYAPPKGSDSTLAKTLHKLERLDPKGTPEQKGRTLEEALAKFSAKKLRRIANTTSDELVRKAAQRAATKQALRNARTSRPKQPVGKPPQQARPKPKAQARRAGTKATATRSPVATAAPKTSTAGRKVRR